jgi:hypothetical protein
MKGVDQRTVTVGTSPVTLCASNPARVAVQIGCPLGTAGAWIAMLWDQDPTATGGMPLFFGQRPMMLSASEYG